jgi:O-antigen ligase
VKSIFIWWETKFAIFALIFFTRVLDFESFFKASEAELEVIQIVDSPLTPILSFFQHGIFLITLFLLFARGKNTIETIFRGKFIWILIALIPLSVLWSDFPALTLRRSIAFIETCAFGIYLACRYNIKQQLKLLGWAIGIAVFISAIYTIALPEHGIESGIHAGSWRGPFIQKNIFARLVTLGFLTFVHINPTQPLKRYLLITASGLSITLIVLSNSKTALAILLVLLALIPIYRFLRSQDIFIIPFLLTIFLSISCLVVWLIGSADKILAVVGKDITLSGRTIIWTAIIDKIQERLWLGYGYVSFWQGIYGESQDVVKGYGTTYIPPHSHNGFLELALALGLLGVICFILTLITTTRRALLVALWTNSNQYLWPLMYLSFLLIYNLMESTLVEHNSIFWIIYLALVFSRYIEITEDTSSQSFSQKPISLLTS